MSTELGYDHDDNNYSRDTFRYESRTRSSKRSQPTQARRRGKSPQSVNGIHRRRKRKLSW